MAGIKGTNVASKIVPYTTSDNYATHDEEYGRGGYRTVNTVTEMNAIPADRRKEGMLVYVKNDKCYRLNSSNTFVDAEIGSSGGSDIYIVNTDKLNFELISDGKDATNNELTEVTTILERWGSNVIPLYSQSSIDRKGYAGVLDVSVVDGTNINFSIPYNDTITLYSLNLSIANWSVLDLSAGGGGSGLDWDSAHNFSQNGYQKFNNGLMIQWGYMSPSTMNSTTGQQNVYMPTSFYNTYYTVVTTVISSYTSPIVKEIVSKYNSYFIIKSIQHGTIAGEAYNWIAIGRWK